MNIASSYWEKAYFDKNFNRSEWQAHPLSLQRLSAIQGGQPREDWFFYKYLKSQAIDKAVSIGAGRAETEIEMLRKGYVKHFVLMDISAAGINYAKERAIELGIGDRLTCIVVEPGTPLLEADQYDLVMFVASLHHMDDIRGSIKAALRGLNKDGFLWCANEYVGPNRFNYPKAHVDIVEAYYALLPLELCKHKVRELVLPTPEEVAAADPSEAPHSDEIIKAFQSITPNVDFISLYGSFAFIVFWGLNHDALYDHPDGRALVGEILRIDQTLVEAKILPNYFAHIVVRNFTSRQLLASKIGIDYNSNLYSKLSRWRRWANNPRLS